MNEDESILLHLAAQEGDAEAITALVNAGADPNAQGPVRRRAAASSPTDPAVSRIPGCCADGRALRCPEGRC